MKKNEVQIGGHYLAKVSGKVQPVKITGVSRFGGWDATNTTTNKAVRIKSAQRLRGPAKSHEARSLAAVEALAKHDAATPPAAADAAQAAAPRTTSNPLNYTTDADFADKLNLATATELEDALTWSSWSPKQRSRIIAAIKTRTTPRPAEDVAKTVDAVTKGDLTKGVEIPMSAKRAHGRQFKQADAGTKAPRPEGKMSGLDAAAKVLAESPEPLNAKQIVEQAAAKGYWSSTAATPWSTIYAAVITEIAKKGDKSRFKKADRGLFTVTMMGQAAGEQAK